MHGGTGAQMEKTPKLMPLPKRETGAVGPRCAACMQTSIRRMYGYWCPRCRRWLDVPKGESNGVSSPAR